MMTWETNDTLSLANLRATVVLSAHVISIFYFHAKTNSVCHDYLLHNTYQAQWKIKIELTLNS